jgi:hypothetical protein
MDFDYAGKWQTEYSDYQTLELHNDKSFTYTQSAGCSMGTYQGTWTYLNAHTILLSFPFISDDVLAKAFDPLLTGKKVQVQVIDSKTMKIDSLAQNVVLKRVGE